MVENVQCPVCTLFLHAGMSLYDHLETHPKEQVIKALVKMTITSSNSPSVGVLKAALLCEANTNDKKEQNIPELAEACKSDNDVSRSNSRMSTMSSVSTATSCSTNNILNFTNSLATAESTLRDSVAFENTYSEETSHKSNSKQSYQTKSNHAGNEASTISDALNAMHFGRLPHQQLLQQQQTLEQKQQTHFQQPNQSQFKIVQQKQQPATLLKQNNFCNTASQQQLPPPPPPMPVQLQQSPSLEISATIFSTNMQQNATYAAANQRQQQHSPKILYSGGINLPPPPPLQLFSYQHSAQQHQHQKPPPAYGTAISQIRSQQNQNKQNPTQSTMSLPHKAQDIIQQHQQLALQRHVPNSPTRIVSHVASQLSTITTTTSTFSSSTSLAYASSSSKSSELIRVDVCATEPLQKLQPPPPPPLMQVSGTSQKPTNTSVTFSQIANMGNHQTSSSFSSLIAAQSPSSVLRFAESPVAHYLERENGDFIVQETPKHIVECVEEDDGEFSVIERFHQSPPSVLHIHDAQDDDNDSISESLNRSENSSKNEFAAKVKTKSQRSNQSSEKNLQKQIGKEENAIGNCYAKKNVSQGSTSSGTGTTSELNSDGFESSTKKTSKNTITVLSDVQLNLNEYLDLMGNIIASGKMAKRRATCSASAPIPLVKVEKVEPDDEDCEMLTKVESEFKTSMELTTSNEATKSETPFIPLLQLKSFRAETEYSTESGIMLDEMPSCSKKCNSIQTSPNEPKADTTKISDESNSNNPALSVPPIHLTSVIRMATNATMKTVKQKRASTPPVHQTNPESTRNAQETNDEKTHQKNQEQLDSTIVTDANIILSSSDSRLSPQDLSQSQKVPNLLPKNDETEPQSSAFAHGLPPPPPLRKGPKKLVIKPKSPKTEDNAKKTEPIHNQNASLTFDVPSTSQVNVSKNPASEAASLCQSVCEVVIKCEPGPYEISCSSSSGNIEKSAVLQKHLKSSSHSEMDFHKHSSQYQADNLDVAVDYSSIKNENESQPKKCESHSNSSMSANASKDSATADARVLLDFANSTKRETTMEYVNTHPTTAATSFFSSTSLFSSSLPNTSETENPSQRAGTNYTSGSQENTSSSLQDSKVVEDLTSVSRSQSAATNSAHIHHHEQQQQQQISHNNPNNNFGEFPFSFFYGSANNAESPSKLTIHQQLQSFSSMYNQTPDATTTAATVASSSTLGTLDDSTSTTVEGNGLQSRFGSMHNTIPQWYQPATVVAHSDFSAALSTDNAAADGDVGKYLDLDACKRGGAVSTSTGIQTAPSSTSSSFAAATDSSLAGGCTTDTLNIRTDEKMPPKGEISEQESNCDIENSWSQPVYGEIPSKFYRTTFPGIFPHDAGWNQDEFFTVQDLSPSANGAPPLPVNNSSSKPAKSFDFHLPLEAVGTSFASTVVPLSNDDVFPSTSVGVKKKKKRDCENGAHRQGAGRSKPTSTITSQQFMQNEQLTAHNPFEQTNTQRQQKPTTSTAAAREASTATAASPNLPTRVRRKVYVCPHCNMEFNKLRDKNHHMIETHNYVRQNRRLISTQTVPIVASASNGSEAVFSTLNESQPTYEVNAASGTSSRNVDEYMADSKHNIKIKMEYDQPAAPAMSQSLPGLAEDIHPKVEFLDEKANVLENDPFGTVTNTASSTLGSDTKPPPLLPPLPLATAPTTKLATLYRMLISFNVSTLKQSQNLSESEEKLIESSIFFCYTCRTSFSSVKLYDAHLTEHPAECFTCGKNFQRWKNFSLHLKRHLGWKEFGCNVCDKKFVVRSALVEHTRMHTGHTPLKCKVCGKSFKRYSNLTQHRKRHGRLVVRKKEYVCHCGEVLPSKARFLWHKETHDSKPKCCPHCCDRFVHANSLRRHIRLAHSDKFDYAEPMECPMCKQVFAKSSIKAHMATHSMDTQHDCNICNKSFSTKWNLKIHLWVHANRTAKPFKCEHCPKAFVREVDFKNHMNAHKQIKPYTCEYCGCKFIRKYNYMRHRREHHGNKKFTCDLCKKCFHRHYYLIEHRRIHTGERPFQCSICGKSSTTKTNHNKHLRIHHSRDPFTVEA